jgi:hypothetical protein
MSSLNRAVALAAVVAALGCGGPRNLGQLPDGGAGLPGTWDLLVTPTGSAQTQMVVAIGTNSLSITDTSSTSSSAPGFIIIPNGSALDITLGSGTSAQNAIGTRNAADFAGGIIPFDLGGAWSIQGGATPVLCNGHVGQAEIDNSCSGGGGGSPSGAFTVTRNSTESSDYGDLGGAWTFQDPGGGLCTMEFKGATATSICSGAGAMNGSFTVQFNGNTVSGTAPGNVEFIATRRAQ